MNKKDHSGDEKEASVSLVETEQRSSEPNRRSRFQRHAPANKKGPALKKEAEVSRIGALEPSELKELVHSMKAEVGPEGSDEADFVEERKAPADRERSPRGRTQGTQRSDRTSSPHKRQGRESSDRPRRSNASRDTGYKRETSKSRLGPEGGQDSSSAQQEEWRPQRKNEDVLSASSKNARGHSGGGLISWFQGLYEKLKKHFGIQPKRRPSSHSMPRFKQEYDRSQQKTRGRGGPPRGNRRGGQGGPRGRSGGSGRSSSRSS